jgi:cytochrome c553
MKVLIVLVPFVLAGLAVIFVAFSGGPTAAREAYLTRGGRILTISIVLLYIALGVVVPAAVIAGRDEGLGATDGLATTDPTAKEELGKQLFIQNCKSCHTLEAVQAHGVIGPNLDELGGIDKQRVLGAIKRGGTGSGRMPPGLLEGEDADAVATYVASVAGR